MDSPGLRRASSDARDHIHAALLAGWIASSLGAGAAAADPASDADPDEHAPLVQELVLTTPWRLQGSVGVAVRITREWETR